MSSLLLNGANRCIAMLASMTVVALTIMRPANAAEIDVLAHELLGWIAQHSDLEPSPIPDIHFASPSSIASMEGSSEFGEIVAVYDIDNRVVTLSDEWDIKRLRDQSILLHELVHHLQITNSVPRPCVAHLNALAYTLQLEWLGESGIENAPAYIGVNDAVIFQRSLCTDPFGALQW
jgi:hypothetical protein